MLQQRQIIIPAAARKAHCSSDITPHADSTTMAIMMAVEMMVP